MNRAGATLFAAALPAALAASLSTTGCGQSAIDNPGLGAYMQVRGAQFVRGPMPSGSASGPAVVTTNLINTNIYPNLADDSLSGALGPTATAAAIGLRGDIGYWRVVAGAASISTPQDPSFAATAAFSAGIVAGQYTLLVQGVDADGTFGPPAATVLTATGTPPTEPLATGALVVTLTWNTDVNLSLHVVDPAGAELYWGAQSTEPPFTFNQVDGGSYGTIDFDSNANCEIDGLDREDATWASSPPPGTYTVRVDTPSLCGQPIAYWTVKVVLEGKTIGMATGTAVDADTRGSHGVGSGVTALTFDVP